MLGTRRFADAVPALIASRRPPARAEAQGSWNEAAGQVLERLNAQRRSGRRSHIDREAGEQRAYGWDKAQAPREQLDRCQADRRYARPDYEAQQQGLREGSRRRMRQIRRRRPETTHEPKHTEDVRAECSGDYA